MLRNTQALLAALMAGALSTAPAVAQGTHEQVYFTPAAALAKVFADADSLWVEAWAPSSPERQQIERRLGWKLEADTLVFHRAQRGGQDLGWAMVTDEIGLHLPITFLVHVTPARKVGAVWVLVFRESRGGEIHRERFLRQFAGKDLASPLRLERDIVGITGATLSARASTAAVRRVLTLVDARYGGP
jgi:FAD:protein FMN transferase